MLISHRQAFYLCNQSILCRSDQFWCLFPGSGATEGDYDYVYSLYARTVAELGAAADNYWMNINGSDEDKALGELIDSCSNSRIYITHQLK